MRQAHFAACLPAHPCPLQNNHPSIAPAILVRRRSTFKQDFRQRCGLLRTRLGSTRNTGGIHTRRGMRRRIRLCDSTQAKMLQKCPQVRWTTLDCLGFAWTTRPSIADSRDARHLDRGQHLTHSHRLGQAKKFQAHITHARQGRSCLAFGRIRPEAPTVGRTHDPAEE